MKLNGPKTARGLIVKNPDIEYFVRNGKKEKIPNTFVTISKNGRGLYIYIALGKYGRSYIMKEKMDAIKLSKDGMLKYKTRRIKLSSKGIKKLEKVLGSKSKSDRKSSPKRRASPRKSMKRKPTRKASPKRRASPRKSMKRKATRKASPRKSR